MAFVNLSVLYLLVHINLNRYDDEFFAVINTYGYHSHACSLKVSEAHGAKALVRRRSVSIYP